MLPKWLAWATVVIEGEPRHPGPGFFGFILLPVWLFVTGFWLTFRDSAARGGGGATEKPLPTRAAEAVFTDQPPPAPDTP